MCMGVEKGMHEYMQPCVWEKKGLEMAQWNLGSIRGEANLIRRFYAALELKLEASAAPFAGKAHNVSTTGSDM